MAERCAASTEPLAVRNVVQRGAEAPEVPAAIAAIAQNHAVLAVALVAERAPGPLLLLLLLLTAQLRRRLGVLHRDVARRIGGIAHHGEPRAADGATVVCLGPLRDAREAEGGVRAAVQCGLPLGPREADNAGLLVLGAAAEAAEWSGAGVDDVCRLVLLHSTTLVYSTCQLTNLPT
jgi:hypothetical protein